MESIPSDKKDVLLAVYTTMVPVTISYPITSLLPPHVIVIDDATITTMSDNMNYTPPPTPLSVNGYVRQYSTYDLPPYVLRLLGEGGMS